MQKNKQTFYDWCIENNKLIYLENWDYERNEKTPKDYSYGSAYKIYFKCPRHLHDSTYKPLNNITSPCRNNRDNYCLRCNSFAQWCIDNNKEHILNLWDYDKNKVSPYDIGYASNKSYYFKCSRNLHDSHKHVLSSIVGCNNQVRCTKCESIGQFGLDNIENFIEKYWSKENICSPFDIAIGCNKKILINCQICGDTYKVRADHFANGIRHKGCSLLNGKSRLQRKVEDYISFKYKHYTLLHENNCTLIPKSPINNYNLYFDNEIVDLKLLIEVHGAQHYKTCIWDKMNAERNNVTQEEFFQKRKFYDKYKKDYALKNGYLYLEIPYWTEKDESYKNIIDDKINQITKEVA